MSDRLNHVDPFPCGAPGALVAYLYDDCEPGERERIETHLRTCAACTADLESLGGARRALAAWTPPAAALGFQLTAADPSAGAAGPPGLSVVRRAAADTAPVLRPSRWWQRPLPAWGQAAAAALIFAAGLAAGSLRPAGDPSPATGLAAGPAAAPSSAVPTALRAPLNGAPGASASAVPVSTSAAAVSKDDLARLERVLRAELARTEALARAAGAANGTAADQQAALVAQVEELIAASEQRQRTDLLLVADAVGKLDAQRRYDVRNVDNLRGLLTSETRQNSEALRTLFNVVGYSAGPSVPIARPVSGR